MNREFRVWGLIWVLAFTAVAAGVLVGGLILGALSPASASRPAQDSRPAVSLRQDDDGRPGALAVAGLPGLAGAPTGARMAADATASARVRLPAPAPGAPPSPTTGTRAASSEAPRSRIPLRGSASWYCQPGRSPCTAGHPATGAYAAAGPALRAALGDWRGRTVTVSVPGRAPVEVRLVDWCRCDGGGLIDLYAGRFEQLAPLDAGRVPVTVTIPAPPERSTP